MAATRKGLAFRDLDRLFRRGTLPPGDGALLECFLAESDETAFEAIVARHGSMVLGVCRRLLRDPHDADDAFQATFLVLVKKARSLRDADRLGPWLYGVATRVATKARAREAKRREYHRAAPVDRLSLENGAAEWIDVRPILDAELSQLPAKLRDILILCLLEGSTAEEAARRLSCPVGTVKSRLARGREALRGRLTARGLAPGVALAVASAAPDFAFASTVSQTLAQTTARMAGLAPEQIPRAVDALTRGVATSMLHKSSVLVAVACGGIVLAGAGLATWSKSHATADEPDAPAGRNTPHAARAASIEHLSKISLAFQNFLTVENHFPPPAVYGADGQPKLSWRVALLPWLGHEELYKSFYLDEPWDSPHNKALIARMPDVFTTPGFPTQAGTTRIQGFTGPGTMFDGVHGVRPADVFDGTSNTLMIAIGREAVPWTSPNDFRVAPGKPLPALDDTDASGAFVGLADGSVRNVPVDDQALLRRIINRAEGEVLVWPAASKALQPADLRASETHLDLPTRPSATRAAVVNATANTPPASPIPPELEQRLRAIEVKLNRLMRKLETADHKTEKH
jgi:RNA polymerase sigma factor (sigma-70 family)